MASLFGRQLPEFGISERVQRTFFPNRPLTAQGGSQLFGYKEPQVAGAATNTGPVYGPQRPFGPAAPTGGGGGSTAQTAYSNPPANTFEQAPSESGEVDFDSLIQPALQALEQTEGAIRGQSEADIASIETGAKGRVETARGQQKAREGQLAQQQSQVEGTAESATQEARRGFSEIQQGLISRFGTGVSTGLGATGILGAQTLKNIANIRNTLQQAVQQIGLTREAVKDQTDAYIRQAETETETQKQQARSQLQNNLAQIGQARGELQSRKAEMGYSAMQNYQQVVQQISARNTQFQQQIYLKSQEAQQKLESANNEANNRLANLSFESIPAGNILLGVNKQTGGARQIYPFAGTQVGGAGTGGPEDEEIKKLLGGG